VEEDSGRRSSGGAAVAPESAVSTASAREQQEEETRTADTMKEWSQQIVVLLLMNVIYKTCRLAYHTGRHNCLGHMTWRRGRGDRAQRWHAVASQRVCCTPILNRYSYINGSSRGEHYPSREFSGL
jgi:hypothetical protein